MLHLHMKREGGIRVARFLDPVAHVSVVGDRDDEVAVRGVVMGELSVHVAVNEHDLVRPVRVLE